MDEMDEFDEESDYDDSMEEDGQEQVRVLIPSLFMNKESDVEDEMEIVVPATYHGGHGI